MKKNLKSILLASTISLSTLPLSGCVTTYTETYSYPVPAYQSPVYSEPPRIIIVPRPYIHYEHRPHVVHHPSTIHRPPVSHPPSSPKPHIRHR
jgi:hypothetical protein